MKMKFFILFMLPCWLHAQKINVGILGGVQMSYINIKKYEKAIGLHTTSPIVTYKFGIRFEDSLHKKWSLITGIFLNEKGYTENKRIRYITAPKSLLPILEQEDRVKQFVDLPILISYHFKKHFSLLAGTGINIDLNNKRGFPTNTFDIPIYLGLSFSYKRITCDLLKSYGTLPYYTGTYDLNYPDYYTFFHKDISIALSYSINSKKYGCKECLK